MRSGNVISALNDVIAAWKDREDCFQFCLERAPENYSSLKTLLIEGRLACAMAATELQSLVRAQGEEPETSVSLGGAFHRNWLDIKAAIVGIDRDKILEECDNAAEHAARACLKAMEMNLSPRMRSVLERQYQAVINDREKISTLRSGAELI